VFASPPLLREILIAVIQVMTELSANRTARFAGVLSQCSAGVVSFQMDYQVFLSFFRSPFFARRTYSRELTTRVPKSQGRFSAPLRAVLSLLRQGAGGRGRGSCHYTCNNLPATDALYLRKCSGGRTGSALSGPFEHTACRSPMHMHATLKRNNDREKG